MLHDSAQAEPRSGLGLNELLGPTAINGYDQSKRMSGVVRVAWKRLKVKVLPILSVSWEQKAGCELFQAVCRTGDAKVISLNGYERLSSLGYHQAR